MIIPVLLRHNPADINRNWWPISSECAYNEVNQYNHKLTQIKQDLCTVEAELTEKKKLYQDAEKELQNRKEILDMYIKVDSEIASAINNSEAKNAKQILEEIESKLENVDDALRQAISMNKNTDLLPIPL